MYSIISATVPCLDFVKMTYLEKTKQLTLLDFHSKKLKLAEVEYVEELLYWILSFTQYTININELGV